MSKVYVLGNVLLKISLLLIVGLSSFASATDKVLQFSGYNWIVHSSDGLEKPGPNHWESNNAWVDSKGFLHLLISYKKGKWYCPEVYTQKKLSFGTYRFWVQGLSTTMDPNIVLGLFLYPDDALTSNGTNEIDIEISRWGDVQGPNLSYTVWPTALGVGSASKTFAVKLTNENSSHKFNWSSRSVTFQTQMGLVDKFTDPVALWVYNPKNPKTHIAQKPMSLHMNLWLADGNPIHNNKTFELVIKNFFFLPQR